MKLLATVIMFFSIHAIATTNQIGLGVVVGDPTGLSFKKQLNSENAIDAALAWSSIGFHIHGNYLWQKENYLNLNSQNFDLFYGLGARVISIHSGSNKNKTSFGPRTPIGLNYRLKNTQLQFFVEAALNLNLTPSSDADLDAGIGMRFHF